MHVRFIGSFDPVFQADLSAVLEDLQRPVHVTQLGRSGLVVDFEAVDVQSPQRDAVQTSESQLSLVATILREAQNRTRYKGCARQGEIEFKEIKRLISNRYFTVVVYHALFPASDAGNTPHSNDYHVIRWSEDFPAGAIAIPITTDGRILLIQEMNAALAVTSWKLPTGSREPGETFEDCALREGKEEAGLVRTDDSLVTVLGEVAIDPNVTFDGAKIVLVTNVEVGGRVAEETEAIKAAKAFTIEEVEELVKRGEVLDALSLAALCRLQIILRRDGALRETLGYALE